MNKEKKIKRQIKDLPSNDDAFWDGEKIKLDREAISVCNTHTKDNWTNHAHYIDNHDGSISCKFCPWGCNLPGYMRVYEGRIIDLRNLNRADFVKAS